MPFPQGKEESHPPTCELSASSTAPICCRSAASSTGDLLGKVSCDRRPDNETDCWNPTGTVKWEPVVSGLHSTSDREREGTDRETELEDTHGLWDGRGNQPCVGGEKTEEGCDSPLNTGGLVSGNVDSKPHGDSRVALE